MRCPSCGEDNPDRARFCLNCATPLTAAAEPETETRKVVTIVFADMADSTAIGEQLDPEALRRVQARYFDEMTSVLERHGGTVEKYIGDAVMAVFGIPRLHEDDPLRAVRATMEMQAALAGLNDELERDHGVRIAVRIGVNTGEVVSGDAVDQRLVTGDTVNVAARLEQVASGGEVILGDATYRLVRDAVAVEPVEELTLKGKSEPVPAYRLRDVSPGTVGHERHLDSPMVGRAKELELLRQALDRARDERTSHLFTLLGPAGVGKSRLMAEFLAGVGDVTVLRGRCLSYGEGITYFAVGEVVRQAASIAERDDDATALASLTALLAEAEEGARAARLIGGLFGWADPSAAEDAAWGVRRLLEHLARERPLVVVLDDIHWADPLLLDLVEYLAEWTRDAELLLVCVARPELLEVRPDWGGGKLNATSILLEPLGGDEAEALLANLLGEADLPTVARERILAAAEGNPLFVEEMVGVLIDDGLLRFEEGAWRSADDLAELTVPPTIQLLLAARLDRLNAEERAVIGRGSVEGKVFHTGAVVSLSPEGLRSHVRPRLIALTRKELIRPDRPEFPGDEAFRFRHLLIRDAAYHAMPKEQRADLHESFARWLTQAAGDRLDEYQEILAHHLEQAYRYRSELGPEDDRSRRLADEAAAALHLSAKHALDRSDFAGAIRLLDREIELAQGDRLARALVDLGELFELTRNHSRTSELLGRFLDSEAADSMPALRIRADVFALLAMGMMSTRVGIDEAVERATELLAQAEATGDPDAIRAAVMCCSWMAFYRGRCAEARTIASRLLPDAQRMNPLYRTLVTNSFFSDAYFGALPVQEGFALVEQMRSIMGDSVFGRLRCDMLAAHLSAMAGDDEMFQAHVIRSPLVWEELGQPEGRFQFLQATAECARWLGHDDQAEACLRDAKAHLDAQGEVGNNSTVTGELATLVAEGGRIDEAEQLAEEARGMTAPDDFGATVPLNWVTSLIASARGNHDAAVAAIDEAVETAGGTDYLSFQADTARVRGRILLAAGRHDEARDALDEAESMFERKGNVAALGMVRTWRREHAI